MRFGTLVTSMVVLTGLLAVNALATEKALKKSELPAAVQKTADEQSKNATIRGYSSEVEGCGSPKRCGGFRVGEGGRV